MFKRGKVPKNDRYSLRRMNMKAIIIFLRDISDIGSETMLQKRFCAFNGAMVKLFMHV